MDFEVQRCTRRCAKTERDLQPGEEFYSVLVGEAGQTVRYDYSVDAWGGPPESVLGWWKSQMPDPNARKLHWAPNDVILHYFEQLNGKDDQQDVRYVLALLMVRRRIVRLEDTEQDENGEIFVLYCPRKELEYRVDVVEPTPDRVREIQEEVARLLFAGAA